MKNITFTLLLLFGLIIPKTSMSQIAEFQGTISSDWTVPGNWYGGALPTSVNDVEIKAGVTADIPAGGTYSYNKLYIKDGATLTINSGTTVTIATETNNIGIFNINGGTLKSATMRNGTSADLENEDKVNLDGGIIVCTGSVTNYNGNYICKNSSSIQASGFTNGTSWYTQSSTLELSNTSTLTVSGNYINSKGTSTVLTSSTLTAGYFENKASQSFVINESNFVTTGSTNILNYGIFDVYGASSMNLQSEFRIRDGGVFNVKFNTTLSFPQKAISNYGIANIDGNITGDFTLNNGSKWRTPGLFNINSASTVNVGTKPIYNYWGKMNIYGSLIGTGNFSGGNSTYPIDKVGNTNIYSGSSFDGFTIYNYNGKMDVNSPTLFTPSKIINDTVQTISFVGVNASISGGVSNSGILEFDGNNNITANITINNEVGAKITAVNNAVINLTGNLTNAATFNFGETVSCDLNISGDMNMTSTSDFGIGTKARITVSGSLYNVGIITVKSDIASTGSFMSGTVSGTGQFKVERWIDDSKTKWQLVSSPLNDEYSSVFIGHFMNYYDELPGNFVGITATDSLMYPGEGFAVKYSGEVGTPTTNPMVFENGVYNVGNVSRELVENGVGETTFGLPAGFNLVGNPYQSPINWEKIYSHNTGLNAALYYYVQASGWLTYNANSTIGDDNAEYINIGQGFGVVLSDNTTSGQTIGFVNTDRVHEIGNGFQKKSNAFSKYFELNSVSGDYSSKIYFRINEDATSGFDNDYDAYKLNAFDVPEPSAYFVSNNSDKLAICETPETDLVNLGFNMSKDGEVTFSLSNIHDFSEIVLEDKENNKFINLLENDYTFNYSSSEKEMGRFVLHLKHGALSENELSNNVKIFANSKGIFINSDVELNNVDISIYNMTGELVLDRTINSFKETKIDNTLPSGVYIIKLVSDETVSSGKFMNR